MGSKHPLLQLQTNHTLLQLTAHQLSALKATSLLCLAARWNDIMSAKAKVLRMRPCTHTKIKRTILHMRTHSHKHTRLSQKSFVFYKKAWLATDRTHCCPIPALQRTKMASYSTNIQPPLPGHVLFLKWGDEHNNQNNNYGLSKTQSRTAPSSCRAFIGTEATVRFKKTKTQTLWCWTQMKNLQWIWRP